jgi:hypothetical protein
MCIMYVCTSMYVLCVMYVCMSPSHLSATHQPSSPYRIAIPALAITIGSKIYYAKRIRCWATTEKRHEDHCYETASYILTSNGAVARQRLLALNGIMKD